MSSLSTSEKENIGFTIKFKTYAKTTMSCFGVVYVASLTHYYKSNVLELHEPPMYEHNIM